MTTRRLDLSVAQADDLITATVTAFLPCPDHGQHIRRLDLTYEEERSGLNFWDWAHGMLLQILEDCS